MHIVVKEIDKALEERDHPSFGVIETMRGFMVDPARCLESRASYRRFIEFCAARGMNTVLWHFTDDQGCSLRFDSMPDIASPNAYSKDEMRELVAFARERGITMIPELETLGHSRYITRLPRHRCLLEVDSDFTAICPVAKETRRIMSLLLREVAEVFDSPWIHVGLDEVNFGDHPLTRKALEKSTSREILLDYIHFIHREVSSHGRRMIMWGDQWTVDQKIAPLIPQDVIIANWQYGVKVSAEQIRYFLDLGLDVLLCPALITYDQQFLPGNDLALANIRDMSRYLAAKGTGKVLGIVTTIWTGTRFFHDAQWLGLGVACELMKMGSRANLPAAVVDFARSFYGCDDAASEALRGPLLDAFELAPLRAEFLSIVRLKAFAGLNEERCRERALRWEDIEVALNAVEPAVRRNIDAFKTFRFAARLMAYLYNRAGAVISADQDAPDSFYVHLMSAGKVLYSRMLQIWDSERFNDDPKKGNPLYSFDNSENLISMFRESLGRFAALIKASLETSLAGSGSIHE